MATDNDRLVGADYEKLEGQIRELFCALLGQSALTRRRNRMRAVADALKWEQRDENWRLRGRRGVWFSNTQGQAANAGDSGCTISVQMLGEEVGKLEIDRSAESQYLFFPEQRYGPEKTSWKWSRNQADGIAINAFLGRVRADLEAKPVKEREVQWQLAKRIDGDDRVFRRLRTVRWLFPTEIAVALTREGNAGTGTADLLVRRDGGKFFVIELKRPAAGDVTSTVKQAIRYAAALSLEANVDDLTKVAYRTAFGSSSNDALVFGAVVAMDRAVVGDKEVHEVLDRFDPRGMQGTRLVDRLGMLLYRWDEKGKVACDWKWLEGWDPRAREL